MKNILLAQSSEAHGDSRLPKSVRPKGVLSRFIEKSAVKASLAAASLMLGLSTAGAQVSIFSHDFEGDTGGWSALSGTLGAFSSGTGGIPSASGANHAVSTGNVFTRFGEYRSSFPTGGYSTSVKIYLDVDAGWANDRRFDWIVASNKQDGGHLRDYTFNVGFYDSADATGPGASTNRFIISASNNAGPGNSYPKNPGRNPVAVGVTGWYVFEHHFQNVGGALSVELVLKDPSNNVVSTWTLSAPADLIASVVGGNRYGWLGFNTFSSLAVDDSALIFNDPAASLPVLNVTRNWQHATITGAVVAATAGEVIRVSDGNYTGNVAINKNLTLESENGRDHTTITGVSGVGSLGAVVISGGTTAVTIGGTGKGFTIVGIDNGSPGLENAALYFQGGHTGVQVIDNEIVANGDAGLISEYGAAISGWLIDNNEFSGQTFVGANPVGGNQFTVPNVSRQLVVLGNGGNGLATATNITFTNNQITGTAGGLDLSMQEQGNTLVTLDVANSTITGNTFSGTTKRFAGSLRVRRPDTTISGNSFVSTGLGINTSQLFVQNNTSALQDIVAANTFDKGVYVDGSTTVGLNIQGFIDAVPAGTVINVLGGSYSGSISVNKNVSLHGANTGVAAHTAGAYNPARVAESILEGTFILNADNISIAGFEVTGGADAFRVSGGGQALDNISITNNYIHDTTDSPIRVGLGFGGGIGSDDWIISGNLIEAINGNARTGMVLFNIDGLTLTNNVINHDVGTSTGRRGINLDGVLNATVTGNAVNLGLAAPTDATAASAAAPWAIQISMSDRAVENVDFSNNSVSGAYRGITVLSQRDVVNATITGNTVSDVMDGVAINTGSTPPQETGVTMQVAITSNTIAAAVNGIFVRDLHDAHPNGPVVFDALNVSGNIVTQGVVQIGKAETFVPAGASGPGNGLLNVTGTINLAGSSANDAVQVEGSGNVSFQGGAGSNIYIGGAGVDTAVFEGISSDYTIVFTSGSVVVTRVSGGSSVDTLTNVEKVQFADTTEFLGQPVILSGPASASIQAYEPIVLSATVSGYPAPTYQWYFNDVLLNGETASSLSVAAAISLNAGTYKVVATNTFGSDEASAVVTVIAKDVLVTDADLPLLDGNGDPVPGVKLYRPLFGVLNNDGRFIVKAQAESGSGGILGSNNEMALTDASGALAVIGQESMVAGGGTFAPQFRNLNIHDTNFLTYENKINGVGAALDQAYLVSEDGQSLDIYSQEGDVAAGADGGAFKTHNARPAIAKSGIIYLGSQVAGGTTATIKTDTGIWYDDGGTSLELLVREGDAAPTMDPAWVGQIRRETVVAGAAKAAFVAALQNDPLDPIVGRTNTKLNQAILAGEPGQPMEVIARKGDEISPGLVLLTLISVAANQGENALEGHVYIAKLSRTGGVTVADDDVMVIKMSGGSPEVVVREGADIDGRGTLKKIQNYYLTNDGKVVFKAQLNVPPTRNQVICRWDSGVIEVLAQKGTPSPDGPNFGTIATLSVSPNGMIAFRDNRAVWRDVGGGVQRALKVGDLVIHNGSPRSVLAYSFGLARSVNARFAGGGFAADINDAGAILPVLSIGSGEYIVKVIP